MMALKTKIWSCTSNLKTQLICLPGNSNLFRSHFPSSSRWLQPFPGRILHLGSTIWFGIHFPMRIPFLPSIWAICLWKKKSDIMNGISLREESAARNWKLDLRATRFPWQMIVARELKSRSEVALVAPEVRFPWREVWQCFNFTNKLVNALKAGLVGLTQEIKANQEK